MRVMVFFDLPVLTASDRKGYRDFRKFLIKSGFLMLQESVYCKLVPNDGVAETLINNIRKNRPENGLIQVLRVTEKQYNKMDYVLGKQTSDVVDSDERLIIL